MGPETAFACLICFFLGVALMGTQISVAYRSGVIEGYGYARGGRDRGQYREAGEYLRRHCADRFPELRAQIARENRFRIYDIDDE